MLKPPSALVRATFVLATLMVTALPAAAQWKWRDSSGQITASDLPPPRNIAQKDILQRPDPAALRPPPPPALAASAAPVRAPVDPELEARRKAGDADKQAKARADEERLAAQRADNCRNARGHVAALNSGQRIARSNDKGEREVLDDRGRADEMRRANEVIQSDCR